VDDVHRKPKDDERDAVVARIKRASREGRISDPDRDIRLGNVGTAQSVWELDLIARELDQLEAVAPPVVSPVAAPTPQDTPATAPGPAYPPVPGTASRPPDRPPGKRSGSPAGLVAIVVTVLTLIAVGAVVVVAIRTIQGLTQDAVNEATDRAADPGAEPADSDPGSDPTAAKYGLTKSGINGFLKLYRERFGTNRVVDLTMYEDYAIVNVPKPKSRQESWVYRPASGFSSFGGVRATFPGARPVSTNRLAVPALVRNISRARARLNVEDPTQTYVILRFIPRSERVPSVNIYVGNEFNESGYMATTMAGKVKSTYPFRRQ
jgi:hypothetical protein